MLTINDFRTLLSVLIYANENPVVQISDSEISVTLGLHNIKLANDTITIDDKQEVSGIIALHNVIKNKILFDITYEYKRLKYRALWVMGIIYDAKGLLPNNITFDKGVCTIAYEGYDVQVKEFNDVSIEIPKNFLDADSIRSGTYLNEVTFI